MIHHSNDKNDIPLVSVVVVTYNSEHTVIETLESIKNQTYQNIELVISDDCSKDNTSVLCRDWLRENGIYFHGARYLDASCNTGVAGNCNRGYRAAKGSWIKGIAGDDVLESNCIEELIHFQVNNPEANIIVSDYNSYKDFFLPQYLIDDNSILKKYETIADKTARRIFNQLCVAGCNFIPACTLFISSAFFNRIGGFDEDIPACEDYPFFLKATSQGEKPYRCNKKLVKYRISNQSISHHSTSCIIRPTTVNQRRIIYNKYIKTKASKLASILFYARYKMLLWFSNSKLNNNSKFNNLLFRIFLSPFRMIETISFII